MGTGKYQGQRSDGEPPGPRGRAKPGDELMQVSREGTEKRHPVGSMAEDFPEMNFELVIKENEKHGLKEQNFPH